MPRPLHVPMVAASADPQHATPAPALPTAALAKSASLQPPAAAAAAQLARPPPQEAKPPAASMQFAQQRPTATAPQPSSSDKLPAAVLPATLLHRIAAMMPGEDAEKLRRQVALIEKQHEALHCAQALQAELLGGAAAKKKPAIAAALTGSSHAAGVVGALLTCICIRKAHVAPVVIFWDCTDAA